MEPFILQQTVTCRCLNVAQETRDGHEEGEHALLTNDKGQILVGVDMVKDVSVVSQDPVIFTPFPHLRFFFSPLKYITSGKKTGEAVDRDMIVQLFFEVPKRVPIQHHWSITRPTRWAPTSYNSIYRGYNPYECHL